MRRRFTGLWRNPDFVKLWAGETVSVFGSLIGGTALQFTAILVLDATPFQIALLAAASLAPGLLFGLAAGVWVDRLRRRPILIAADVGRALLLVSIPLTYALDSLRIEQLYAVAFLAQTLTTFFDVAYLSYLPSLVRREELVEGNSKLTASASVAEVGGFGLAGWLVQVFTAPVAILIDAFSFLFSALFVGSIRAPEPGPAVPEGRRSMAREIGEGLSTVLANPILRAIAGSTLITEMSFRIFGTLIILYGSRELGFSPGALGMIFAVGGISSLVGALVAKRSAQRLGLGRAMVLGVLLMGVSMLFVPLARGPMVVAGALLVAQQLLGDGAFTVYEVTQVSLRQAITSDRLLGRVNAGLRFSGLVAMLIGALMAGLLGEALGLRPTLFVGAGGLFLAALWLVLSQVGVLKESPTPVAETSARMGPDQARKG